MNERHVPSWYLLRCISVVFFGGGGAVCARHRHAAEPLGAMRPLASSCVRNRYLDSVPARSLGNVRQAVAELDTNGDGGVGTILACGSLLPTKVDHGA